jgi:hypothetical protein
MQIFRAPAKSVIKSVQRGILQIQQGVGNVYVNIAPVDLSKSFLSVSGYYSTNAASGAVLPSISLSSASQLYARRSTGGYKKFVTWEVIEYV